MAGVLGISNQSLHRMGKLCWEPRMEHEIFGSGGRGSVRENICLQRVLVEPVVSDGPTIGIAWSTISQRACPSHITTRRGSAPLRTAWARSKVMGAQYLMDLRSRSTHVSVH